MSLYWQSVLTPICIDAVAVLGLYVIAMSGRLSAGHAVYVGVGAYTAGVLTEHVSADLALSMACGFAITAVLGAVYSLIVEPLEDWFFAVSTLAFGLVVSAFVAKTDALGGALGIYGAVNEISLGFAVLVLACTVAAVAGLGYTRWGRRCRAVRDDPLAARSLGINVRLVHMYAFAIGCGIAGVAGALRFNYIGFVQPDDMSFENSLLLLVYLTIGGATVIAGPVFGTFALGLLPELLRPVGDYRLEVYGALVVIVMVFRPSGLVPNAATLRGWRRSARRSILRRPTGPATDVDHHAGAAGPETKDEVSA